MLPFLQSYRTSLISPRSSDGVLGGLGVNLWRLRFLTDDKTGARPLPSNSDRRGQVNKARNALRITNRAGSKL